MPDRRIGSVTALPGGVRSQQHRVTGGDLGERPDLVAPAIEDGFGCPHDLRAILAFKFPDGFGLGLGTIVLCVNAALLSLFSLSCNSCRHICGGYLNSFHSAPSKFKTWTFISQLNEKHMQYAWVSLIWVALAILTFACFLWARSPI